MFARIAAAREKEEGFTLIELLVVIIIIGILAAIAIPVFLNQRKKGWDSAVKADLRNAATAQETYLTDNGVYSVETPAGAQLTAVGFKYSPGTNYSASTPSITVAATGNSTYCLTATSASTTVWHYSSASGLGTGACS
ncbi:MAG: prepilin-type N-terminal cleavage/methylation domain-containing protein [Actinobacteria bacterium]|nr:MAG: prepilin-type N-terminal cleavage/methylation domain-containing protein [Actinomycetota bacterium]